MKNEQDTPRENAHYSYNAFISYNHGADNQLANRLQTTLQKYHKPLFKSKALKVFRYKSNLPLTDDIWAKIVEVLKSSEFFILLASPGAAKSKWVQKEVNWWLENRPVSHMHIVLTEGEIHWDENLSDFDWAKTTALPGIMKNIYRGEPAFLDFRSQKNVFLWDEDVFLPLAAVLHHKKDPGEMRLAEIKKVKKEKRIAWSVSIVMLFLSLTTSFFFFRANKNEKKARKQLSQNYWNSGVSAKENNDWLKASHHFARCAQGSDDKYRINDCILNINNFINQIFLGAVLNHKDEEVYWAKFSNKERLIVTISSDQTLRLWDAESGFPVGRPMKHPDFILSYDTVFNREDSLLLSWSKDGFVRLWNTTDGTPVGKPMKHENEMKLITNGVKKACFSTDGKLILTTHFSFDGTIKLWNVDDCSLAGKPITHGTSISGARFSKDGKKIITWRDGKFSDNRKGTIYLWNIADSSPSSPPMVHESEIEALALSNNGRFILTRTFNRVRLWNMHNGKLAVPVITHASIDKISGACLINNYRSFLFNTI